MACGAEAFTFGLLCVFSSTGQRKTPAHNLTSSPNFSEIIPALNPLSYKVILRVPSLCYSPLSRRSVQPPDPLMSRWRAPTRPSRQRLRRRHRRLPKGDRSRARTRLHPQRPGLHLSQDRRKRIGPRPVPRGHAPRPHRHPGGPGVRIPVLRNQAAGRGAPRFRPHAQAPAIATAEQAFQNIDRPLAAGIAALAGSHRLGADNFSAHFELATLAEQRDELELAAEHYEKAWRILPDRRSVLVDLGRVWKSLNRPDEANAALLAASRGGEPRAAEMARELLPDRYPFVSEFRAALALDPANVELRRELGYLLLRMDRQTEAEQEFRILAEHAPGRPAVGHAARLPALRARRQRRPPCRCSIACWPATTKISPTACAPCCACPQILKPRADTAARFHRRQGHGRAQHQSRLYEGRAEVSADRARSRSGRLPRDAASSAGPTTSCTRTTRPFAGSTWRAAAPTRRLPPKPPGVEATCMRQLSAFRTTVWMYPLFSTRWNDLFSYGQVKTELRTRLPFRPVRQRSASSATRASTIGGVSPQYLSESSFIRGGRSGAPYPGTASPGGSKPVRPSAMSTATCCRITAAASPSRGIGSQADRRIVRLVRRHRYRRCLHQPLRQRFPGLRAVARRLRRGPSRCAAQLYWNGNLTVDSQRQVLGQFRRNGSRSPSSCRLHAAFHVPHRQLVCAAPI